MEISLRKNIFKGIQLMLICLLIIPSCEQLDFKRVMDTSTDSVSINGTTVVVYGTVLDVGEGEIISHGHCWATHENPDINDLHTDLGQILGPVEFWSTLKSISPGVKNYVRSYLYNGVEFTYGDQQSFEITADDINFSAGSLKKISPTSIEVNSSTIGLGSVDFSNHGHCWSQTDPPTVNDKRTNLGQYEADSVFVSQIDSLTNGRYYIRGYLETDGVIVYTNSIIYESEISVKTGAVSINANNSISVDGEIMSLGLLPILEHGHCWSDVTSNPNFNSNKTSLGPIFAPMVFTSNIYNLDSGKKYYIRSYATDGSKVYYGSVSSFIPN
jgi:hypothetical protein